MFCNCTLVGTKACENCYNNVYGGNKESQIAYYLFTDWDTFKPFETYNPETHELVEKKDAKIKRLKNENELKLSEIENLEQTIERLSARIKEKKEVIDKNNKELEELEL